MKHIYIILLLAFAFPLSAQEFHLFDEDAKTPIEWASVRLYKDSKLLQAVYSDENGVFVFSDSLLLQKDTRIRISAIGYLDLDINFDSKTLNYFLEKNHISLDEIIVKGRQNHINFEDGKLIYDIGNDALNNKSIITNGLRNLPLIDVDLFGKVASTNNKKILFLLNGREDPLVKEGNGLNSINARLISRIELVINPDQEYISRGYDLILNIISKTELIEGTLLTLNPSINDRGVFNHNVFFSYRKNRMNVTLNTLSFNKKYKSDLEGRIFPSSSNYFESATQNQSKISASSLDIGRMIKGGLINLYLNADLGKFNNRFENSYFNTGLQKGESLMDSDTYTVGVSLRKNKVFKNTNNFSAASFSVNDDNNMSSVLTEFNNDNNRSDNQTKTLNLQSTFTSSLSNTQKLTYGGQYINRNFDLSAIGQASELSQNVISLLGYYNKIFKNKWSLDAGTRLDFQKSASESAQINYNDGLFLIPKIRAVKNLPKSQVIMIDFSSTIGRPSTNYFNAFVDYSNPLMQTTGNPNLKPERKYNSGISYSKYGNPYYWGIGASHSFSFNQITRVIETIDGEDFFKYENSDSKNTVYASLNFGGSIFKRKLSFDTWSFAGLNKIKYAKNDFSYFLYHISFNTTYNIGQGYFLRGSVRLNSPHIYPQGRSSAEQDISLSFSKAFLKNMGNVVLSVNDPFLTRRKFTNRFDEFETIERRQARVVSLSVMLRLGKLSEMKILRGGRTTVEDEVKK